ncbi:hypothetical protein BGX38DRAFT_1150550, partial [Terfezia claveryi]
IRAYRHTGIPAYGHTGIRAYRHTGIPAYKHQPGGQPVVPNRIAAFAVSIISVSITGHLIPSILFHLR